MADEDHRTTLRIPQELYVKILRYINSQTVKKSVNLVILECIEKALSD